MIRFASLHRISLTTVAVLLVSAATVLSQGDDIHLSFNGNVNLIQPSGWQVVLSEPTGGPFPFVYETVETIGAWGAGASISYPVTALLELRTGAWFDVQRYSIEHISSSVDNNGSSSTTSKNFAALSTLTIPLEFVLRVPITNSKSTVIVGAGAGWYLTLNSYQGASITQTTDQSGTFTQTDNTEILLDPESTINFTGRFGIRTMYSERFGMELGLLMTVYPLTDHEMRITSAISHPLIDPAAPTVHSIKQSFTQIRLYAAFDLQFGE